jgi:hypothetical protein
LANAGSHARFLRAPAFAPVSDLSAAWLSKQVIADPDEGEGAKVWERFFYRSTGEAAGGCEEEDEK